MPEISVILPTRDRPEMLSRAVRSVLAQEHAGFELIVVDNNAATPPLSLESFPNPRLRLVRCPEAVNAAQARNAGLAAAAGEWISYLDDDDEYLPGKLARQLDLATRQSAKLVLCGARLVLNQRDRLLQCSADALSQGALLNDARWSTPLLFHRREPELRFDPALGAGEDAHFAQALLARWNPPEVPVVPEPLVVLHQEGPARPRTNLRGLDAWRADRRLWWQFGKRYPRADRRLFVRRSLVTREKALGHPGACLRLCLGLLRTGGVRQARFAVNALVLSCGFGRGRLVS